MTSEQPSSALTPEQKDAARRAVRVLADLRGQSPDEAIPSRAVPLEWFEWLPGAWLLFEEPRGVVGWLTGESADSLPPRASYSPLGVPQYRISRDLAARIRPFHHSRRDEGLVHVGALWIAGHLPDEARGDGRVLLPIIEQVVAVHDDVDGALLRPVGDPTTRLTFETAADRPRFEQWLDVLRGAARPNALAKRVEISDEGVNVGVAAPDVGAFARWASRAGGLPAAQVVGGGSRLDYLFAADPLMIVAGVALFIDVPTPSRVVGDLDAWVGPRPVAPAGVAGSAPAGVAGSAPDDATAFHALYTGARPAPSRADRVVPVGGGPFALGPRQREAVEATRSRPVTVVSGAPGTGKSQAVLAAAADALVRGTSVLIATSAPAAVDALLDLLSRVSGPAPVVFGSSDRRLELAARLERGTLRPVSDAAVASSRDAYEERLDRRMQARADLAELLGGQARLEGSAPSVRATAPWVTDPGLDVIGLERALAVARRDGGWWSRWRAVAALHDARALVGDPDASLAELEAAMAEWRDEAVRTAIESGGGLRLDDVWPRLVDAEEALRPAAARWLAAECAAEDRLRPVHLAAVTRLVDALSSPRARRRRLLEELDWRVTEALPLWLGTLSDIEDLLPAAPGLFETVLFDEASSVSQLDAVGALWRARRVVVVGDPMQLRPPSFVADTTVASVLERHGVTDPAAVALLDVRRNTLFDVAASVAPVIELDEHVRSVPDLMAWVADELYDGRVHLATWTPATEVSEAVRLVRVDGARDERKVVVPEVDAVLDAVSSAIDAGVRSIGIASPFRAQATAIGRAVAARFPPSVVDAVDLRVSTVHGFQGNEREVMVLSLGVGEGEGPEVWRFVEDPHLFSVLVTRARRRQVVVWSGEPPVGGLVARYLGAAAGVPGPAPAVGPVPERAVRLAGLLGELGVPARAGYPVGRHVLDLVVGDAAGFLGVEVAVHPEGRWAHIDRHQAMVRAGWTLIDAFAAPGVDDRAVAEDLAATFAAWRAG